MTLDGITRMFREAGIEDARHEALLLIECFAEVSPAWALAYRERDYDAPALLDAVQRRAERYPLQYLLGMWEFCGLRLRVTPACLIPRPDTEIIAVRAAELLPPGGRFLDLCTGSGCIAAAVLALAGEKNVSGAAVDLSEDAAALARENLSAFGFADRCPVIVGDAALDLFPQDREGFDVIVSNPPYIAADEMRTLAPELGYEPEIALTDGGDGLALIRAILTGWRGKLKPGGVMLIEHGWKQGGEVERIARDAGYRYRGITDYGGNLRAAELSLSACETAIVSRETF